MIYEPILVVSIALFLDFLFGDPKTRYHPTSLIGTIIAKLVPLARNNHPKLEKLFGIILVICVVGIVVTLVSLLELGINFININSSFYLFSLFLSIGVGAVLLKTTIAIRGTEDHSLAVMNAVERNELETARKNLAMIVKRNTKDLDKNHIISGTLESVSENTVDGITGPLFYFAFFGLWGALVYRAINTIDSMIGYKTSIFKNVGWFGANCDKVLNYLPEVFSPLFLLP